MEVDIAGDTVLLDGLAVATITAQTSTLRDCFEQQILGSNENQELLREASTTIEELKTEVASLEDEIKEAREHWRDDLDWILADFKSLEDKIEEAKKRCLAQPT